jgi:hypothetical protein
LTKLSPPQIPSWTTIIPVNYLFIYYILPKILHPFPDAFTDQSVFIANPNLSHTMVAEGKILGFYCIPLSYNFSLIEPSDAFAIFLNRLPCVSTYPCRWKDPGTATLTCPECYPFWMRCLHSRAFNRPSPIFVGDIPGKSFLT